jgi:signal transduction histidine kinase
MTSPPGRSIVLADRIAGSVDGLMGALATRGCDLIVADTVAQLRDRLAEPALDAVLLDAHGSSRDEWIAILTAAPSRGLGPLLLTTADHAHRVTAALDGGADALVIDAGADAIAAQVHAQVRRRQRWRLDAGPDRAAAVEALERKEQELAALNYAISHDLRAPLRAIEGFSRIVLEESTPVLATRQLEYLQRVCAAAREMAVLIDDLLQLSRVGRAEIRRSRVDLSEMASRVAGALHDRSPERAVDVVVEDGLVVQADRRLLQTALEQLFDNSWKFTGPTAAPRIELLARHDGPDATFALRDNGVGFDMKQAAKLFKPFQRLHSAKEFTGAGIGLAVVHRIVSRHGGRVWAEAIEGSGATVYFTLPPAPKEDVR